MAKGTPALQALAAAGIEHTVHEYSLAPRPPARDGRHAYGPEAAAALGLPPERVFKTLVATVDGRLMLAIVPVAGELDLKRLADAVGGRKGALAEPVAAERTTG